MSSRITCRLWQVWPSPSSKDLSRAPPVSVSSVRVSDTAITAMESGLKLRSSNRSVLNIARVLQQFVRHRGFALDRDVVVITTRARVEHNAFLRRPIGGHGLERRA